MKKRIFSGILAVVMLVTAVFATPKIPKTAAYDTFGTNATWNSAYHALSEDAGTAEKPGFVGKYTYTMTAAENEYSMPDKFAVVAFNDCEAVTNADGITTFTDHTGGAYITSYVATDTIGAFQNLATYDGGSKCFAMALGNCQRNPQNVVGNVTNGYTNFDITNYQYLRFHMFAQNVELDSAGDQQYRYFKVQLHLNDGSKYEWNFTDEFKQTGTAHDIFIDVSSYTGIVKQIQFHVSGIRRISNDNTTARLLVDNIRFIKNATHSDVFSYTPNKEIFRFHDCDNSSNIQIVNASGYSNYTKHLGHTNQSGSIVDGAGSVVFGPNGDQTGVAYGKNDWYQLAFQNSTGVVPSEYQYMRFYAYFGDSYKNIVNNLNLSLYYCTEADYNTYKDSKVVTTHSPVTISNYKLAQGWYMVTVNVTGISQRIKSISIQFGAMTVPNPGANQDPAKIHIDFLHFFRYNYTPNTVYSYLPGHYKVLESFENYTSTSHNTSWQSYVVNRDVIHYEAGYKNSFDGWATGRSGTTAHPTSGTGMFSAAFPHQVTHGRYAAIWRPNINANRDDCWVQYQFKETYDLSKFTHFSLDMSLRDMQKSSPKNRQADQPGLTGNNERFMISLYDVNGNSTNLVFYLKKTHDYNNFISSPDHLVEGFPLYGFVPGYNERDHGQQYTPIGPMRLVLNMGQVMDHRANGNFDLTKITGLRVSYIRGSSGRANTDYEYAANDERRVEVFLDNFVAFTPDMTLNVQTTGITSEDADQRVVIGVNGNDAVTNHVDVEYSAIPHTNNGLEIIKNLPLNSYLVSMQPWAWRYHQTKSVLYQSVPRLNDTVTEGYTGISLGYKTIANNKSTYLTRTITFDLTRYHSKWLDANGYAAY